jgi:hypothetical protein
MARQTVQQGTCTGCNESDENFTITDKTIDRDDDGNPFVQYDTRCECGETGSVTINGSGISSSENVSHDNASWNESDEEGDDDE